MHYACITFLKFALENVLTLAFKAISKGFTSMEFVAVGPFTSVHSFTTSYSLTCVMLVK